MSQKQNLQGQFPGGYEGHNSEFVKLVSSDGFAFIIRREYALKSTTIQTVLSCPGGYAKNEANEVLLSEIKSHTLLDVCRYFNYKMKYGGFVGGRPPAFPITTEAGMELILAANFLGC